MNALIPLIEVDALPPGRGRRVCKAGLDIAVFKAGDAVFAIDDSCPHAGGSASPATLQIKKYAVCTVDGTVMLDPGA